MNKKFKIVFPTGYQINNIYNDNIDVNVYLSTGEVYFATLFTVHNIEMLMKRENDYYFYSDSMIIFQDLSLKNIKEEFKCF